MTKLKTKKLTKNVIEPVVEPVADTPKEKGEYRVFTKINGIENDVYTADVAKTILTSKPTLPKTNLVIRVTKGKVTRDRYLLLREARRLYSNETTMMMFVKNLLL